MKASIGSYSLKRQLKPRAPHFNKEGKMIRRGWNDPAVPEYCPNWMVTFTLPKSKPIPVTAKLYPICAGCMAEPENPAKARPDCSCVKAVRRWANEWLETQTVLMQRGEVKKLQELRAPAKTVTLQTWIKEYLVRGPADRQKRVNALESIVEESTGLPLSSATWDTLTRDMVISWAEMRQEAGRRGWLGRDFRKNMPKDAWQQLRALRDSTDPERRLPPLDTQTAAEWNTSILSYLVKAKTIVNEEVRKFAMRSLNAPEVMDFRNAKLPLPTTKGHKEVKPNQLLALLTAADELRERDPQRWVINQMLMRLACRPEEVMAARPSWLEEVGKRTVIRICNRKDEGFKLKAGAKGVERVIALPEDLLAAMMQVKNDTSLIGAKHPTEAYNLVMRDHSGWIREVMGLDGHATNYILRHLGAAERMTSEDAGAAAALLGHTTDKLILSTYGKSYAVLEPLRDEEILRRFADAA